MDCLAGLIWNNTFLFRFFLLVSHLQHPILHMINQYTISLSMLQAGRNYNDVESAMVLMIIFLKPDVGWQGGRDWEGPRGGWS